MRHLSTDTPYSGFMAIDRLTLQYPDSPEPFTREILRRRPAACLLAYDSTLNVVLMVEEFRAAHIVAGLPADHWLSIGPVAGIIEDGQSPLEAALREAEEEAGLVLTDNYKILDHRTTFVSPGSSSEIITHFVIETDLSHLQDGATFGLGSEHERTTIHLVPLNDARAMLHAPTPINGLLATCLLMLFCSLKIAC